MTDHKPADYVLDEFLAKHHMKVPIREFGKVLHEVRAAVLAEAINREAVAGALHDYDHAHSWRDERFCPNYACVEIYPPRADAVLALIDGGKS